MKYLFLLLIFTSFSSFSKESQNLGENANPKYRNCLGEDKCPSQICPNSCAMMNNSQYSGERRNLAGVKKKNGKAKASAQ